jgi:hypothetical protein
MRPPKRSVHIPSGSRISEPVRTGIATRMPNCVSLRPSDCLIGMPMTANIIQTMKHTVNEVVLAVTTDHCLNFSDATARPSRLTVSTPICRVEIPRASLGRRNGLNFDVD